MKRLFLFIALLFGASSVFAQQQKDIAVDSFKVDGSCNMCKKRIEDAAYIKGVKRAEWNKDSKMLTIVYKPSKTSEQAIQQHIAHAGHNAGAVMATEDDYHKLPECCAYKSTVCPH